jgi:hypothetical protein
MIKIRYVHLLDVIIALVVITNHHDKIILNNSVKFTETGRERPEAYLAYTAYVRYTVAPCDQDLEA